MKRNKMKKGFWTLNRHNSEGFTLVELIVVIAILAILAGVGVPVYSGYITRANKQADQTLVSEVANALQLYYYSHSADKPAGFVVLNSDGSIATADDDGIGSAAMEAAFGSNWAETAKLKYNGWTDDGLLKYVLDNADSAPLIAGSTFLTTATPEGLMNAVTGLTDAATNVIKNYADKGGDVSEKLAQIVGDDFVTNLNGTGVTNSDEAYETVISNMLVGHYAEVLNGSNVGAVMNDDIVGMMLIYAEIYAYCETIEDENTISALNNYLAGTDDMDQLTITGLNTYLAQVAPDGFMDGFLAFSGTDAAPGQGYKDIEAALEIMGAVDLVAGTYTDKESLSNSNLYSSDSVSQQLNNYINAVKAVATMDTTTLANLADKAVVVFLSQDGGVSVVPGAAYLAG